MAFFVSLAEAIYTVFEEGPFSGTGESQKKSEMEQKGELCDCDPEYKDTQTVQKSKGGNIGPIGGNHGDGTTVIVCRNCGERFYEDEDDGLGPDLLPGPGPF